MIGIDIIKIERIAQLQNRFGQKGLEKFLHVDEIALVKSAKNAAGFWAAKEAAAKALGSGIGSLCSFKDIKIAKQPNGKPTINFSKKVIEHFQIQYADLSITHDGGFAIAVVTIETKTQTPLKGF